MSAAMSHNAGKLIRLRPNAGTAVDVARAVSGLPLTRSLRRGRWPGSTSASARWGVDQLEIPQRGDLRHHRVTRPSHLHHHFGGEGARDDRRGTSRRASFPRRTGSRIIGQGSGTARARNRSIEVVIAETFQARAVRSQILERRQRNFVYLWREERRNLKCPIKFPEPHQCASWLP